MADDAAALLQERAIKLDGRAGSAVEAIRQAGQLLVDVGAVSTSYVDSMLERERSVSTVMGEGVAIPHGTNESKSEVLHDALSFVRFPEGVDWNGKPVTIAIGIAATGDNHVGILSRLATILVDPDSAQQLREATETATVLSLLRPDEGDEE
jgi:mannitol PTS system EIIA component